MKEQLGISASKEELLGYFTQPSYEEARLAWKELMGKWNQEKVPEVAKNGTIPWPDILGSLFEHPERIQTTEECCSLCHHKLLIHDFRSPSWTWTSLCGRGGMLVNILLITQAVSSSSTPRRFRQKTVSISPWAETGIHLLPFRIFLTRKVPQPISWVSTMA